MKAGRIHYFGPPNAIVIDEILSPTPPEPAGFRSAFFVVEVTATRPLATLTSIAGLKQPHALSTGCF